MDEQRFPRLARAQAQERAYQARKAAQGRAGYQTFDIAAEEMLRSTRAFAKGAARLVEVSRRTSASMRAFRLAFEALAETVRHG